MISLPRAVILWPLMIINSVSPLRYKTGGSFAFCLSLFATPGPSMYAFQWRSVGISTCHLSRFIAMMQMRVCKDRMALGLYL